ncbi:MAG: hypothetical protein WCK80_01220 [bacterium]
MFGHQDNTDDQKIPDHKIEEALKSVSEGSEIMPQGPMEDDWQHPGTPINDAVTPPAPDQPPEPAKENDLGIIKQQALSELSPLIKHLEQTPEEKFKVTMMMIQASDDQSLIQDAYEAARRITDESKRAQALLDVVNEINYFTQTSKT